MVNLRPETDPETEYVAFDRPRVLRVLSRIIADLDELAGYPPIADEEQAAVEDPEARRARHRRRLARARPATEAVERSGKQEERAALWAALGLPPHEWRSRPTPVEIGIRPFPSRGGLGKGPLNETPRLCREWATVG